MEQQQSERGLVAAVGDTAAAAGAGPTADFEAAPTFKLRLSLGTKLLAAVMGLLVIVIAFLSLSTIFLFRQDKRAYVYQAQSTSSVLAGREFVNVVKHVLDTLRLSLAAIDPNSTDPNAAAQHSAALQPVVKNQSEAFLISVDLVKPDSGQVTALSRASRDKELAETGIAADQLKVSDTWLKPVLPELLKNSFAYMNLSGVGSVPLVAIFFADLNLRGNPAGMPVATAIVSLRDFGKELNGLNMTIATQSGWVLYDSDPAVQFSKKTVGDDPLFVKAQQNKLASGASEYDADGEHFLGSYVNPGYNLTVIAKTHWSKAMAATYSLIQTVIYLGLMATAAAAVFAILFSSTLTAPLKRLYEATREVARGNFDLALAVKSSDEIGALTSSFNVMSSKISELIEEQLRKAHLENELAIASTVQQTLIPGERHQDEFTYIRSHYQSASECGGDWWGFFRVGNRLVMMIADATGHGLPSALITASARSCVSVLHKLAQDDPEFSYSPAAMLSYANRVVFDASMGKIMMTFFVGVVDFDAKTLTYSSAGHNPPWLFKKTGEKYQLKSLTAVGQRLGEAENNSSFEEKTVEVSPEDFLFLYTDGLMEGKDSSEEMYGKKRVRKLIESKIHDGPETVVDELMADFMRHNGDKPLDDDVTIAAAVFFPPQHGFSGPAGEGSVDAPA